MAVFALIAEGPTDQVVLERIIDQVCGKSFPEGIETIFLQPLRDETDRVATNFGGWELVLEYCKLDFNGALESSDFVVVHIDTDAGEHPNFGVALTENGEDRDHADLVEDTKKLIVQSIGKVNFELVRNKVVFAISVHSIESWVLLCLYNRDEPKGSFDRLQRQLARADEPPLVKEVRRYQTLVRDIKAKRLNVVKQLVGSLPTFLLDLESVSARVQGEPLPEAETD